MKIKIFSHSEDEELENRVNVWLEEHADIDIVKTEFVPTAGGDFNYSSCCIWYREVKPELVWLVTSTELRFIRAAVDEWMEENASAIEIIEHKFAMCAASNADYPQQQDAQFGYCIVYREK